MMITELRNKFNSEFSDKSYYNFLTELNSILKYPTDFRVCETPIFLSDQFTKELINGCDDIVDQIVQKDFINKSTEAIPKHLVVPNDNEHPVFLSLDFAIVKTGDDFSPKLIELQGFPTLYGYQYFLNRILRKHFNIPEDLTSYFSGYDEDEYIDKLEQLIVADEDPENVVLLEIEPGKQKTRIDFAAMEKLIGIPEVCISDLIKRNHKLYYKKDNKEIEIKRIYNRVIFDELERKQVESSFNFFDEVDVQWVGHPNWFFRISKFSLPQLKGKYAPECYFLNEIDKYPDDLENYVLKPLFSFAGLGVDVDVIKDKLDKIADRQNYILQHKVEYAPIIKTPDDYSKVEIRMMYLWTDGDEKPELVHNLIRTSKGKMMGVDFNKNKTWVGSSIAYHSHSAR